MSYICFIEIVNLRQRKVRLASIKRRFSPQSAPEGMGDAPCLLPGVFSDALPFGREEHGLSICSEQKQNIS